MSQMPELSHIIPLPARMDVASVSELREAWLIECEKGTHLLLDCAHTQFVSAAAAQLIIALSNMQNRSGRNLNLANLSPELIADMALLGLSDFIEEHTYHG